MTDGQEEPKHGQLREMYTEITKFSLDAIVLSSDSTLKPFGGKDEKRTVLEKYCANCRDWKKVEPPAWTCPDCGTEF